LISNQPPPPSGVLLLQKEERLRLIISNIGINKSVTEILKYNIAIGRRANGTKKRLFSSNSLFIF
jgi:hypothetical protein